MSQHRGYMIRLHFKNSDQIVASLMLQINLGYEKNVRVNLPAQN